MPNRSIEKYFTPRRCTGAEPPIASPSGRYRLMISYYATEPDTMGCSRGEVFDVGTNRLISDVKRNHAAFVHCFAVQEGKEYLICGEDYQGQTIIELEGGRRVDYLPEAAKRGQGFCWSEVKHLEKERRLLVDGCFWACPFAKVTYDFSKPMELPYPVLSWIDEEEGDLTEQFSGRAK